LENEDNKQIQRREMLEWLKGRSRTAADKTYEGYEQTVDEENVRALLEQINQNGIFTYNPQTSKVSSKHFNENQLTATLMNAVVDMNEVIVAKGKVKPITFVLKSSTWSGSFGNWILHCPYEFKPLNNKEIQFFPRTTEEAEELKQLAKELILSIYE
jgi:hypothetical protein